MLTKIPRMAWKMKGLRVHFSHLVTFSRDMVRNEHLSNLVLAVFIHTASSASLHLNKIFAYAEKIKLELIFIC